MEVELRKRVFRCDNCGVDIHSQDSCNKLLNMAIDISGTYTVIHICRDCAAKLFPNFIAVDWGGDYDRRSSRALAKDMLSIFEIKNGKESFNVRRARKAVCCKE